MNFPLYIHDCEFCVYLGTYKNCDLYVCRKTVVARRSSNPSDYDSGSIYNGKFITALIINSQQYLILKEALNRANLKESQ